ncbi:hypothetical protein CLU83_2244 [Flavobacterium sp. 1]|nr:hypothetical protein CLU83_2244 [Flavobacterium sp. 1]
MLFNNKYIIFILIYNTPYISKASQKKMYSFEIWDQHQMAHFMTTTIYFKLLK